MEQSMNLKELFQAFCNSFKAYMILKVETIKVKAFNPQGDEFELWNQPRLFLKLYNP